MIMINPKGLASTQGTSHNRLDHGGQALAGIGTNDTQGNQALHDKFLYCPLMLIA